MSRILHPLQIEAVLLDYDGVIVDSLKTIYSFYRHICEKHGKKFKMNLDEFRSWFPHDWRKGYLELGFTKEEIYGDIVSEFKKYMDEVISEKGIPLYSGVNEALRKIHESEGPKIGIVSTNFSRQIRHNLETKGLVDYFDAIVGYEEVKEIKPSPEGILTALNTMNIGNNSNVLVVGDSAEDFAAVTRARKEYDGRLVFLFAEYGHYSRDTFLAGVKERGLEAPIFKISSLDQIMKGWI